METVENWALLQSWLWQQVKDDIYTLLNVALALRQPKHRPRFAISIPKHWALQRRTNKWKKNSPDVVVKLKTYKEWGGRESRTPLNRLGHETEFNFFSKCIVVGQIKNLYCFLYFWDGPLMSIWMCLFGAVRVKTFWICNNRPIGIKTSSHEPNRKQRWLESNL